MSKEALIFACTRGYCGEGRPRRDGAQEEQRGEAGLAPVASGGGQSRGSEGGRSEGRGGAGGQERDYGDGGVENT